MVVESNADSIVTDLNDDRQSKKRTMAIYAVLTNCRVRQRVALPEVLVDEPVELGPRRAARSRYRV